MMLALGSVRCRRGLLSVESSLKAALDGPSLHSGISNNSGPMGDPNNKDCGILGSRNCPGQLTFR